MRVLFYLADQNPHRDRSLGITGYTDGLLNALRRHPEVELSALCSRSSFQPPPEVPRRTLPFRTDHVAGRLLADHGSGVLSTPAELWHFPKGHLPLLPPARPRVGTIHDTIVLHYAERYPHTRSAAAFAYWRHVVFASIRHLDLICTVSQTARRQIEAACHARGLTPPPIRVTYEGARWEEQAGVVRDARSAGEYVLHLGSEQPHKRTRTLLERWQALQARGIELPPLRVIGRLDAESAGLASRLQRVNVEPRADDDELRRAMARARALILPSEIEGFGLPALEAFYLGAPAIYVRDTAAAEVAGEFAGGGFLLDDADSLRQALDAAFALTPERVAKLAVGMRARFSWARCAEATLDAYRSLLKR